MGLPMHLNTLKRHGLVVHGVPSKSAQRVADLPPVSTLFASLLGYNPIHQLVGSHVLSQLPQAQQAVNQTAAALKAAFSVPAAPAGG